MLFETNDEKFSLGRVKSKKISRHPRGEAAVKQHRILVMDMRIRSVKTGYRPKQKPCIRNWKLKGENLAKFKCEVSYRLSIVTVALSVTIRPQFVIECL